VLLPRRRVERLSALSDIEVTDLFESARLTQERLRLANPDVTSFNYMLKDGVAAGMPGEPPHIHLHVVPRSPGDLANNDEVYEMIDAWSPMPGEVNTPPAIEL